MCLCSPLSKTTQNKLPEMSLLSHLSSGKMNLSNNDFNNPHFFNLLNTTKNHPNR